MYYSNGFDSAFERNVEQNYIENQGSIGNYKSRRPIFLCQAASVFEIQETLPLNLRLLPLKCNLRGVDAYIETVATG